MTRPALTLFAAALLACGLAAPSAAAEVPADAAEHPACRYCGMDRAKFASSRMLVRYDSGEPTATCSIHCLAVDLALNIDRAPASFLVGDRDTREAIDAETAKWVIVDDKPGVMTRRGKWAFADEARARAFIAAEGGRLATFDMALAASFEDMGADVKAIRERRAAKRKAAAGQAK